MRKTPLIFREDSPNESDDTELSVYMRGESPAVSDKLTKESIKDEAIITITDSSKKRKLQEEVSKNIKTFSKRKLVVPISTNSYFFDNLNKEEFVKYDDDCSKAILDSELGLHSNRKSKMRIKLSDTTSEDHDKSKNDPFSYTYETFIKPEQLKPKSQNSIVEISGKRTKSKVPKSNVPKSVVGSKRNVKTDSIQHETKKQKRKIKKASIIMKDGLSSQSTTLTVVSTPETIDETIDDEMKKRYQGLKFIPISTNNYD